MKMSLLRFITLVAVATAAVASNASEGYWFTGTLSSAYVQSYNRWIAPDPVTGYQHNVNFDTAGYTFWGYASANGASFSIQKDGYTTGFTGNFADSGVGGTAMPPDHSTADTFTFTSALSGSQVDFSGAYTAYVGINGRMYTYPQGVNNFFLTATSTGLSFHFQRLTDDGIITDKYVFGNVTNWGLSSVPGPAAGLSFLLVSVRRRKKA